MILSPDPIEPTIDQLLAERAAIEARLHELDRSPDPSALDESRLRAKLSLLNHRIESIQGQQTLF
jgi:hypothetical protein